MRDIGWAIVTKSGRLALLDGRWPVFWRASIAADELVRRGLLGYGVVKVRVVPVPKKGRKVIA